MNVLAFDCSGRACRAAVVAETRPLAAGAAAGGQAETLVPLLARLVAESGLAWSEIGLIAVTIGPGSFTGLRIALAAARGLALAGGMALAGVPSFRALVAGVPPGECRGMLLAAIESGREEVFVQPFAADLAPLAAPAVLAPAAAARLASGPTWLVGDAAARLLPHIPGAALSGAPATPDPRVVAALALADHRAGRARPALPLYLRAPDVTLPAG